MKGSQTELPRNGHTPPSTNFSSPDVALGEPSSEVDIGENPTMLGRLILNQKFLSASKRVRYCPNEASVWMCAYRPPSRSPPHQISPQASWPHSSFSASTRRRRRVPNATKYELRQLPLHIACNFLRVTSNGGKLEHLIVNLVAANPDACGETDHNGRLPLHEAIAWKASPATISTIFMAYPEAIHQRDSSGHLPLDLNRLAHGEQQQEVHNILQDCYNVWRQTRNEAILRFKLGLKTSTQGVMEATRALTANPQRTSHNDSSDDGSMHNGGQGGSHDEVTNLELLLADALERNKQLHQAISDIEEAGKQELPLPGEEDSYELEDHYSDLRKDVLRKEMVFRDLGMDESGTDFCGKTKKDSKREDAVSMMSMDPQPPTVLTKYLETKVVELEDENDLLAFTNEQLTKKVVELQQLVVDMKSSNNYLHGNQTVTPILVRSDHSSKEEEKRGAPSDERQTFTTPERQSHEMETNQESQTRQKEPVTSKISTETSLDSDQPFEEVSVESSPARRSSIGHSQRSGHASEPWSSRKSRRDSARRSSLEFALKEIDRKSGHDPKPLVDGPSEEKGTRAKDNESLRSETDSFAASFATDRDSVPSKADSRVSSSSWGMLSLAQQSPRRAIRRSWTSPAALEVLPQGNESKASLESYQTEALHGSIQSDKEPVETDNLEELYKSAATLYDFSKELAEEFDGHKSAAVFSTTMKQPKGRRRKKGRRKSDGGASTGMNTKGIDKRNRPEEKPDPFVEAARLLAAEEEITEVIRETEGSLGAELPRALVTALREAALSISTSNFNSEVGNESAAFHSMHSVSESLVDYKLIDEAEKLYGCPISAAIISSLRAAAKSRVEVSRQELEAMESMKKRLDLELIDTLIETAERQLHKPLQTEITVALRGTASSFDSLLQEECDADGELESLHLNLKELDKMFSLAQTALGKPFSPEEIVALRRASFVLQSRLEGTDYAAAQETGSDPKLIPAPSSRRSGLFPDTVQRSRTSVSQTHQRSSPNPLVGEPSPYVTNARNDSGQQLPISKEEQENGEGELVDQMRTEKTKILSPIPALQSPTPSASRGADRARDSPGVASAASLTNSSGSSATGNHRRPRRSKSSEGGDDPGVMYSKARARSRSPSSTHESLNAIYDKAILARTRSPSPENDDDLDNLYKRASLGRASDHTGESPVKQAVSSRTNKFDALSPRAASTRAGGDILSPPTRHMSPKKNETDKHYPSFIVPLNDLSPLQSGEKSNPSPSREASTAAEFDSIVSAAKQVLGHDIAKDLLEALQNLTGPPATSNTDGSRHLDEQGSREMLSEVASNDDLDENNDLDENEDIRSMDMSMQKSVGEVSLNLSAIFPNMGPSDLERKLKSLSKSERSRSASRSASKSASKSRTTVSSGRIPSTEATRERSSQRGVRRAKSGDVELLLSEPRAVNTAVRRTMSAELVEQSPVVSPRGKVNPVRQGLGGSDDLETLYKQAVEQAEGDSTLLASTHHMSSKDGEAAFESIISDTEETYGITIPGDVVEALKASTVGSRPAMPYISMVRALHDDAVIKQAEGLTGMPIPADLLLAIQSTSLPPGVSAETLLPPDYTSSSKELPHPASESSIISSGRLSPGNNEGSLLRETPFSKAADEIAGKTVLNETVQRSDELQSGSTHSGGSWGVLSVPKSPHSNGAMRKDKQPRKKHKKGTKDARFERAKKRKENGRMDFMNSLADLGGSADFDELFKHAKESLQLYSPAVGSGRKQPSPQNTTGQTLEPVLETDSHVPLTASDESETSQDAVPRPERPDSCIVVTPQGFELDLLLATAQKITDEALPFDVDTALRKACHSMDDTIESAGSVKALWGQRCFGAHLTAERLERVYSETEIFLGREIPLELFAVLRVAAEDLLSTNDVQVAVTPLVLDEIDPVALVDKERSVEASPKISPSPSPTPSPKQSPRISKPVDILLQVAQGGQDDLGELYRAAYSESPRGDPNSPPRQPIPFTIPDFSLPTKKSTRPASGVSHSKEPGGKANTTPTAPRHLSPPTASFPKKKNMPLSQVVTRAEVFERTESGRFVLPLSPMTETSMMTDNITPPNTHEKTSLMSASQARLKALSAPPNLEDSSPQVLYEESDEEIEEESLKDAPERTRAAPSGSNNDNDSSDTAHELEAIISEAQDDYGMDLPPELVEALKTASVASLDSLAGSAASPLIMQYIENDENASNDDSLKDLVFDVREKLSKSENVVSRSIARRWQVEEFLDEFVRLSARRLGRQVPSSVVQVLWKAVSARCEDNTDREGLCQGLESAIASLDSIEVSPEMMMAFQQVSRDMNGSVHGQASGYFSAVSDSGEISVLADELTDFDDNAEEIIREVQEATGSTPAELVLKLKARVINNTGTVGPSSMEQSVSSELAGIRVMEASNNMEYSGDLEYSESTFSSGAGGSFNSLNRPQSLYRKASRVSSGNEDNLSRIEEHERQTDVDTFREEAMNAYGHPFPPELMIALRKISVGFGLNIETDFDAVILQSKALGLHIPADTVESLRSAVAGSSKNYAQGRQESGISALTGLSGFSSLTSPNASASSVDFSIDEPLVEENDQAEQEVANAPVPPPPPPPPPPTPPPTPPHTSATPASSASGGKGPGAKNPGYILMKEVKKIYKKRIPLELSYILARNKNLATAMNTDEELKIVLAECEEMSGKRLPADLVLALREASVKLRAPSTSRRSKLLRQGSGSHRSSSRSSGMPSIQEWTSSTVTDGTEDQEGHVEVDRVPSTVGTPSVPKEITANEDTESDLSTMKSSLRGGTDKEQNPPKMTKSSLRGGAEREQNPARKEIHDTSPMDPGAGQNHISLVSPATDAVREGSHSGRLLSSVRSLDIDALESPSGDGRYQSSTTSTALGLSNSLSLSGVIRPTPRSPGFNESTATALVSNARQFKTSKRWTPPTSMTDLGAEIEESGEVNVGVSALRSYPIDAALSSTSEHSIASTTTTEVTSNTGTVSAFDDVSRASTLPSRVLPIGVNPSPPLEGVESDDLSAIFKEAAKRFN